MQLHIPANEAKLLSDTFTKIYPDYVIIYKFDNKKMYLPKNLEPNKKQKHYKNQEEKIHLGSLKRSKTLVSDYIQTNKFDLFVTFTFKSDRYNLPLCKQRLTNYLNYQRKKYKQSKYLVVPEFHKDNAIHFHGMFKDWTPILKDSGKKTKSKIIYNIPSYQLGFSTAIYTDQNEKIANYVTKYITKDMPHIKGKKRFWVSRNCEKPIETWDLDLSTSPYLEKELIYKTELYKKYKINVKLLHTNQGDYLWQTPKTIEKRQKSLIT